MNPPRLFPVPAEAASAVGTRAASPVGRPPGSGIPRLPLHRLFPALPALGLAAGWAQAADPMPIDTLDQASLQETFRLLRTNYVQRETLTLEELNRAALAGLLDRLDFGAELVPASPPSPEPVTAHPLISEALGDSLGYVRPATYAADEIDPFDTALKSLAAAKVTTLILDLRSPAPPAEFAVAARMLNRFLPAGQPLFAVQKPDDSAPRQFSTSEAPLWTGRLVLLIDADCNNTAETIAAVLCRTIHPPLFGSPTRGRTMEYQTAPISSTQALRFASAEMRLPDGSSLFRKGLTPDINAPFDPATKARVFAAQTAEGVRKFITARERPHHNEHALVSRTAPELPFHLARSAQQPTGFDTPPLQDPVLRQAVDALVATDFLQK